MGLDLERLGQNVRFRRTGRGWSLTELAERSGLSKAYLSDLENGQGGRPNVQYLLQVANCLNTTIDELLTGSSEVSSPDDAIEDDAEILPSGLREFAEQDGIKPEEVHMLAQLHFRGGRPRDVEAWRAIYQVIRAVSGGGSS
jgi:transcriptional regulator with XRE-family HTH domain